MVVFPGGIGTRVLGEDHRVLEWLRHAHDHTRMTTSVCTGADRIGARSDTRHRRTSPPAVPAARYAPSALSATGIG